MVHIERPGQWDEARMEDEDYNGPDVLFFLCGAFCTFDVEANALPLGIDFIAPPDPKDLATCPTCRALNSGGLVQARALERVE